MNYVALLRGINVGGNTKVPMEDLRKAFAELGFTDVKTLLNSGNVLFASDETDVISLRKKIEAQLVKTFEWRIDVFIYPQKDIQQIVSDNPFKAITVTPQTRLYITFLSERPHTNLKIPYESPEKNFKILQISDIVIFSVLTLSEQYNTTDAMKILEKEFSKKVTTRNWNTVVKLAAL